jgi:FkbM family methyltransferase
MAKNKTIPDFDSVTPWGAYRPSLVVNALLNFGQMLPNFMAVVTKVTRHPLKYWSKTSVDLVVWGLKLRVAPRGNISEQKLYTSPRNFDNVELGCIRNVLKDGGVFFDIGANAGIYSFWAHVCSKGQAQILGFEPDVEMRRRIDFNIRSNRIESIKMLPFALSDRAGTAEFWVNEGQRGTNSLDAPTHTHATQRQIQVETRTLSDVIEQQKISKIDVMKIDIEGHEPQVLKHFFENVAPEYWPILLISEVSHLTDEETEKLVPKSHYEVIFETKLNKIWKRKKQK